MTLFWKAAAGTLLAVILGLALDKQGKDLTVLLSIAVCCMVVTAAIAFLEPVLDFLHQLEALGDLQGDILGVLFKALGISLVTEIAAMICSDAGNNSLGRTIQMLGSTVILWLSIPIFNTLLELIQKILGEV